MPRSNKPGTGERLSRRAGQILDLVYRLERATAVEIQAELPDPPSYSAVRTHLRILEERGHLKHISDGPRYIYVPTVPRERASRGAMRHLVDTFFEGSILEAVAALLDTSSDDLSADEIERLESMIRDARQVKDCGEEERVPGGSGRDSRRRKKKRGSK